MSHCVKFFASHPTILHLCEDSYIQACSNLLFEWPNKIKSIRIQFSCVWKDFAENTKNTVLIYHVFHWCNKNSPSIRALWILIQGLMRHMHGIADLFHCYGGLGLVGDRGTRSQFLLLIYICSTILMGGRKYWWYISSPGNWSSGINSLQACAKIARSSCQSKWN